MSTFDQVHMGDLIQFHGIRVHRLAHDQSWSVPLLVIADPKPCGDKHCQALVCDALTPMGKRVHLHRLGSREIDVLERAPKQRPVWTPWSAADDPEARAEQADYDLDTPNDEGDDEQ